MKSRLPIDASEVASIIRFLAVGGFNTLLGYSFILVALYFGAGDYLANATGFALGLPISWLLHRALTFRVKHRVVAGELLRYALAVATAYTFNIGVIVGGRLLGLVENPFVQLFAVCVYAAVFYLLSRRFVFRAAGAGPARESSGGIR